MGVDQLCQNDRHDWIIKFLPLFNIYSTRVKKKMGLQLLCCIYHFDIIGPPNTLD